MLERSWKQLIICLTANPGREAAAATATSGKPRSSPEASGSRWSSRLGSRIGSTGHSRNCRQSSAYSCVHSQLDC